MQCVAQRSAALTALSLSSQQILAVDVSIWLHQIVRAMRDKKGGLVRQAHLKAMLSRLCRLLQHGIRPIFVFDGAAPQIKKIALSLRRSRRQQATASYQTLQRKLLQAELKRQLLASPEQPRPSRRTEADMFQLPDDDGG